MGHTRNKQQCFFKISSKHQFCHGGILRRKRAGRGYRSLSTKEPLHVVFKVNRERLRYGGLRHGVTHTLIRQIVRRYAKMFFVKVEQISVQGDHAHLLIRAPRRSKFHNFFRVVSGQIAQQLEKEGLLIPQKTKEQKHAEKAAMFDLSRDREQTPQVREKAKKGQKLPKRKNAVTDTPESPRSGNKRRDSKGDVQANQAAEAELKAEKSSRAGVSAQMQSKRGDISESQLEVPFPFNDSQLGAHSNFRESIDTNESTDAAYSLRHAHPKKGTGLWLHRPFSRVVRGFKAYQIARDYVQLNEQEAKRKIPYRKSRLRGISMSEWEILWS